MLTKTKHDTLLHSKVDFYFYWSSRVDEDIVCCVCVCVCGGVHRWVGRWLTVRADGMDGNVHVWSNTLLCRPGVPGAPLPARAILSMGGLSHGVIRVNTEDKNSALTVQDVGHVMPGGEDRLKHRRLMTNRRSWENLTRMIYESAAKKAFMIYCMLSEMLISYFHKCKPIAAWKEKLWHALENVYW